MAQEQQKAEWELIKGVLEQPKAEVSVEERIQDAKREVKAEMEAEKTKVVEQLEGQIGQLQTQIAQLQAKQLDTTAAYGRARISARGLPILSK